LLCPHALGLAVPLTVRSQLQNHRCQSGILVEDRDALETAKKMQRKVMILDKTGRLTTEENFKKITSNVTSLNEKIIPEADSCSLNGARVIARLAQAHPLLHKSTYLAYAKQQMLSPFCLIQLDRWLSGSWCRRVYAKN